MCGTLSIIVAGLVLMAPFSTGLVIEDQNDSRQFPGPQAISGTARPESRETPSTNTLTGEEINWQVLSCGGDINGVSMNYRLSGTVGQTAVEAGASDNFGLSHGFWQEIGGEDCDCNPGDPNGDLTTNIADAVYLINYIFKGGPAPTPYATCSGDPNADCALGVGDAVYIINFVFKGGPPPATCEEWAADCGMPLRK